MNRIRNRNFNPNFRNRNRPFRFRNNFVPNYNPYYRPPIVRNMNFQPVPFRTRMRPNPRTNPNLNLLPRRNRRKSNQVQMPISLMSRVSPRVKQVTQDIFKITTSLDPVYYDWGCIIVPCNPVFILGKMHYIARQYNQFKILSASLRIVPLKGTTTDGNYAVGYTHDCQPCPANYSSSNPDAYAFVSNLNNCQTTNIWSPSICNVSNLTNEFHAISPKTVHDIPFTFFVAMSDQADGNALTHLSAFLTMKLQFKGSTADYDIKTLWGANGGAYWSLSDVQNTAGVTLAGATSPYDGTNLYTIVTGSNTGTLDMGEFVKMGNTGNNANKVLAPNIQISHNEATFSPVNWVNNKDFYGITLTID